MSGMQILSKILRWWLRFSSVMHVHEMLVIFMKMGFSVFFSMVATTTGTYRQTFKWVLCCLALAFICSSQHCFICVKLLWNSHILIYNVLWLIIYIYHVLINALSTHMIHINSPTETIYIKYYTEKQTHAHMHALTRTCACTHACTHTCTHTCAYTHTHTHTHTNCNEFKCVGHRSVIYNIK